MDLRGSSLFLAVLPSPPRFPLLRPSLFCVSQRGFCPDTLVGETSSPTPELTFSLLSPASFPPLAEDLLPTRVDLLTKADLLLTTVLTVSKGASLLLPSASQLGVASPPPFLPLFSDSFRRITAVPAVPEALTVTMHPVGVTERLSSARSRRRSMKQEMQFFPFRSFPSLFRLLSLTRRRNLSSSFFVGLSGLPPLRGLTLDFFFSALISDAPLHPLVTRLDTFLRRLVSSSVALLCVE